MPDQFGPPLGNFHLAADPQLRRVRAQLEALARNSIRIWPELIPDEDIAVGSTKLGGQPDLPSGVEWPWYHIEMPRPSAKYLEARPDILVLPEDGNVSLPFIGQFDLAELAQYDLDGVLPKTGMLYLFYNNEQYETDVRSKPASEDINSLSPHERLMRAMSGERDDNDEEELPGSGYYIQYEGRDYFIKIFGFDNPDKVRAIHVQAPKNLLSRRSFPPNLAGGSYGPSHHRSCRLKLASERVLPEVGDDLVEPPGFDGVRLTEFEYKHWVIICDDLRTNEDISHMLGYPDAGNPRVPQDLFPLPGPWAQMGPEEKIARGRDHRVILQVDLYYNRRTFFCIRNQDLACGDFSRVWIEMSS